MFDENLDETKNIHDLKMITLVTLKFSSSNETQIEKFEHFLTNSIAVEISSQKQSAFKNSFESLIKIIHHTDFNLKAYSVVYYGQTQLSKY